MEAGLAKPEANVSYMGTVAWAGKFWYVAGTSSEGVKANNAEGTVTLLAKDSFTEMAYREGDASSFAGASFDAASRWYYAGTWTNGPADYLGSSVQTYLSTWLDDSLVSALEQGLAVERPISDVGRTQGIPQKLWLLSQDEQFRRVQESTDQLDPGLIPLGYAGLDALDQSWWTRTGNGADKLHGYAKAIVADPYGPVDSSDYVHNKQAVRPAAVRPVDPVREGYEFNGWATQSGTSFDFDRDTVLGDTQLTAIWAPLPYTVVYDANGAASVDPLACTWDTTHLNAPSPPRENYVFDGWWCGKLVAADTKAGDLARSAGEADRAVTLTAKWVNKKGYSINYDAAGGTAVAGKTDLAYDQAGLLPATVPVRDGYRFVGWSHGDKAVDGDTTYAQLTGDKQVKTITLTAQWKQVADLTFNVSVVNSRQEYADEGSVGTWTKLDDVTTVTSENKRSFTLTVDPDAKEDVFAKAELGDELKAAGDMPGNWTSPDVLAASPGSAVTLSGVDAPEGYAFDGWYLADAQYLPGATVVLPTGLASGAPAASDVEFAANWMKQVGPTPGPKPKPDPGPAPTPGGRERHDALAPGLHPAQGVGQRVRGQLLVVDYEGLHGRLLPAPAAGASGCGSVMATRVPSGPLSTCRVPAHCSSTRLRTLHRPTPASTTDSSSNPGPSSVTSTTPAPSCRNARRRTVPPSLLRQAPWRNAFSTNGCTLRGGTRKPVSSSRYSTVTLQAGSACSRSTQQRTCSSSRERGMGSPLSSASKFARRYFARSFVARCAAAGSCAHSCWMATSAFDTKCGSIWLMSRLMRFSESSSSFCSNDCSCSCCMLTYTSSSETAADGMSSMSVGKKFSITMAAAGAPPYSRQRASGVRSGRPASASVASSTRASWASTRLSGSVRSGPHSNELEASSV